MAKLIFPGDFPANPIEKPGYTLDFNDEFDQSDIDLDKWVPFYLPHWSSREQSSPTYQLKNGKLVLQITKGQRPWCPEFDGEVKCSSLQTGAFAGPVGSKSALTQPVQFGKPKPTFENILPCLGILK